MINFKSIKWKISIWLMLVLTFFNGMQVLAISAVNIYVENSYLTASETSTEVEETAYNVEVLGEDISRRTENEKHFIMSDGSMTAVMYSEDVHYLKDGKYEEIDTSLTDGTDEYSIKSSPIDIKFSKKAKENKILTIKNDNFKLTWGLKGIIKTEGKAINLESNTQSDGVELNENFELQTKTGVITYENVYTNVDLKYTVLNQGIKEEIVLKSKETINNEFVFTANIKDIIATLEENNTIVFKNQDKEVFVIQAPYMYDANNSYSENITLELNETKNGYEITVMPDKEWLEDEAREYPIVIDPTITTVRRYTDITDTWIYNGDDTNNTARYNQHILRVGAKTTLTNNAHRTLIKFDLPELKSGDQVINAEFRISNYPATDEWIPPTETRQIDVHKITKNWNQETVTWKSISTSFETDAADHFMYKYETSNTKKTNSVDITKMVKEWYTTGNNYGLMLKEHNENISTQKQSVFFLSANTGAAYEAKRPVVYITYRNQTGLEGYLSYHTYNVGRAGTVYSNDYNGNLVLVHPDVATLGGVFPVTVNHVYNSNDKTANIGYGNGFRLNLTQTLESVTLSGVTYLKYIDEDGTAHYFYNKDGVYHDEDGMNLTLNLENEQYVMRDKTGNKSIFEAYGENTWRLIKIINTANQEAIITYDGAYISKITDCTGQEIIFTYTDNKLTKLTDPTSREWTYEYTGNNLTKISYPDEEYTTYGYTNNLITNVIDIDNSKLGIEYYDVNPNKVKKVTEYGTDGTTGSYMTITYGTNSTKFVDSESNILYYNFSNVGNLISTSDYGTSIDLNEVYGQVITYGSTENTIHKPTIAYNGTQPVNNLLKDSSFEKEDSSWNLTSEVEDGITAASLALSTETTLYGSKSMKIASSDALSTAQVSQIITGLYAGDYTLSGYIKSEDVVSAEDGVYLTICYTNSNGVIVSKKTKLITGTKDWTRYYVSIKLPEGITSLTASIVMEGAIGTVYVDAMQLETGSTANYYNVVENSNFKNDTTYWTKTNLSSSCGLQTYGNAKAYRIYADTSKKTSLNQVLNISGKAGDILTIGGLVKNHGAKNYGTRECKISIGITKTDGSKQWISTKASPDSNEWQHITFRAKAEADYTSIQIYLCSYFTVNYAEFTNIYLYKGGDANLYTYDDDGNLVSTTDQDENVNSNVYNAASRLINVKSFKGSEVKYEYDLEVKDRLTKAVDNYLDLNYEFEYDNEGNIIQTSITTDDAISEIEIGKTYYIESSSSNKFVDDYARTEETSSNKYLQNYFTGKDGQKYIIEEDEDGLWSIKTNNGTNKYFTVATNGELIMDDYTGEYNQKFVLYRLADGSYYISSMETGYVMELAENKVDKGIGYVFVNYFENKETQRFKFREINLDKTYNKYGLESNEVYRIKVKFSGLYLDHTEGAEIDNLVQNKLDEEKESQLFRVVRITDNKYKLVPYDSESGKAISSNGNDINSNIVVSTYNSSNQDQIWEINHVENGEYTIKSTLSNGYLLGLANDVETEGTNIVLNAIADVDKQKFYFEKAGIFDIHEGDFYEIYVNGCVLTSDENSNVIITLDEAYDMWSFKNLNNGYYIIKNVFTDNVVTISDTGAVILTSEDTTYTNLNQQFELVGVGGDSIRIKPRTYSGTKALSGYLEDISGVVTIDNSESTHSQNAYFYLSLSLKGTISTRNEYTNFGRFLSKEYDELGNVISYSYNSDGTINTMIDKNGNDTYYSYDDMQRLVFMYKGDRMVWYTYDKDKLTEIDNNGYTYSFIYDVFGNLQTTKVAGRTLMTNNYDINNGKLLSTTYGNNHSVSYEYDRFNRVSKVINSDNTYTYAYNKQGTLSYIEDNTGRKDYEYDILNRLISYRYNNYEVEYEYDIYSNVTKKIQKIEGSEKVTEYSVDKAGRLNNTKYDGMLKMYNYDAYSRLNSTELKTDYTSRSTTYSYANVGGTGYSTRVEEVVDNGERTWYNYDSNGNITQILENNETIYEYQYDEHNQLIKEDNKILNKTIEYTYDLTGNITSKKEYEYKTTNLLKEITYTYDSNWLDLLTSYDGKTVTTDAIGNLLTYDGNTYTWINGRSLASISGTKQIAYTYNESGIRTSKTVDGVTTYYEVEGSKVVYEKTGNTIIYYIYDGNGELLGFEYDNNKYYYKKNVQGDIIGILDSFLEEIVTYTYDSWGKLISIKDGNDIEVSSTTHIGYINPYRYRGYRYDNETGYYYLQSRYYNPEWGRFINADAIIANVGVADGYNLFAYCANNPISRSDENGDFWQLAIIATVVIGVIVSKAIGLLDIDSQMNVKTENITQHPPYEVSTGIQSTYRSRKNTNAPITLYTRSTVGANIPKGSATGEASFGVNIEVGNVMLELDCPESVSLTFAINNGVSESSMTGYFDWVRCRIGMEGSVADLTRDIQNASFTNISRDFFTILIFEVEPYITPFLDWAKNSVNHLRRVPAFAH